MLPLYIDVSNNDVHGDGRKLGAEDAKETVEDVQKIVL